MWPDRDDDDDTTITITIATATWCFSGVLAHVAEAYLDVPGVLGGVGEDGSFNINIIQRRSFRVNITIYALSLICINHESQASLPFALEHILPLERITQKIQET